MQVVIKGLMKLNDTQKDKVKRSCEMGAPVLNWSVWQDRVKSKTYKENRGYTGETFLKLFQSKDVIINMEGFYNKSSTVGWTTVHGEKTYINTYFLDTFQEHEVFGHINHEWCHQLGFKHSALRWSDKYKTFPYAVGFLTRDCFYDFYNNPPAEFTTENNYSFAFED